MQIKTASRKKVKLKMGISGASGFGKTYSALLLASGMTNGDWSKIAVIDTENGSAELYSNLGEYNVLTLAPPFSPENYIKAIKMCEDAGMEVVIIDSVSHEWDGDGGCLDIHSALGGQFAHWAKVTPRHKAFIDAILQSSCHIITTTRRKQEYDLVKNDKGRVEPVKVGTKEVTRDGFEYELTLNFELINDKHLARASKDRTGLFADKPEFVINKETGKLILEWCNKGEQVEVKPKTNPIDEAIDEMMSQQDLNGVKAVWAKYKSLQPEPQFIKAKDTMKDKFTNNGN